MNYFIYISNVRRNYFLSTFRAFVVDCALCHLSAFYADRKRSTLFLRCLLSLCHSYVRGGGHRGLLETEKPRKKSLKTAKPQEISSKTENRRNKTPHSQTFGSLQNLSLRVLNFNTYKLILISEVLSGYSLVSAEHILA